MASKTSMIGDLSTNEKLGGSNYDMWHRKIQLLLNEREVLEHLTTTMSARATKDKENKDITSIEEYQASLVAYQEWYQKDHKACYTMLYCIHDDLIGEFEIYPTVKDVWDNIRFRYGKTSKTRLRALHLKWMTYSIDSSRSIAEHVQTIQAMLRDLKAAGVDVSERE